MADTDIPPPPASEADREWPSFWRPPAHASDNDHWIGRHGRLLGAAVGFLAVEVALLASIITVQDPTSELRAATAFLSVSVPCLAAGVFMSQAFSHAFTQPLPRLLRFACMMIGYAFGVNSLCFAFGHVGRPFMWAFLGLVMTLGFVVTALLFAHAARVYPGGLRAYLQRLWRGPAKVPHAPPK